MQTTGAAVRPVFTVMQFVRFRRFWGKREREKERERERKSEREGERERRRERE